MEPNIEKYWFELFAYNLPTNFGRYILRIKKTTGANYESTFFHNNVRFTMVFDGVNRTFIIKPQTETTDNARISGVFRYNNNEYELYYDGINNPHNAVLKRFNLKNHMYNTYNVTVKTFDSVKTYNNVKFTVDNFNAITTINNKHLRLNHHTLTGLMDEHPISWLVNQYKVIEFTHLNETYEFVPLAKTMEQFSASTSSNFDFEQTMFILAMLYFLYHVIRR